VPRAAGRPRPRLIVNPTLQLDGAIAELSRRGIGREQIELSDPRAARYVRWAVTRVGARPRLDAALRRELRRMGVLVPPSKVPRDVWLDARLDLEPTPSRGGTPRVLPPAALRLGAGCAVRRGPGVPESARPLRSEPFLPAEDILWVVRPESRLALPYTLTPRLARALRRTVLPSRAVSVLRRVGALDDGHDADARRRTAWLEQLSAWRRELRRHGHVVLRGLFEPTFLDAMRVYHRRIEREGYLYTGDRRRRGAPLVYDEPLTTFLNGLLAALVGRLTGERARPTFSYLRVYDPGAVLRPHFDRPSCRWNVDLVVGGEPAPSARNAWPLKLESRRGTRTVRLGLGDGLLYRGDEVRHWRRPQPRGRTTVLASLHYGRPRVTPGR
jgi:hypothetical protein